MYQAPNRALKCVITEVWCHQFSNLSIQILKPHCETETVAVRTCVNFQFTSTTESEDREVWSSPRHVPY